MSWQKFKDYKKLKTVKINDNCKISEYKSIDNRTIIGICTYNTYYIYLYNNTFNNINTLLNKKLPKINKKVIKKKIRN